MTHAGAGYSYIDLYPSATTKQKFSQWTADNIFSGWNGSMLNIIDKIQMREFDSSRDTIGEMSLDTSHAPDALIIAGMLPFHFVSNTK